MDACHHAAPAAGFDQPEDGDEQRAQPDQDELQHFVEDGREQAAEDDVDRHGEGGNPDAEVDIPAQDDLHDQRHGVHVDAAHEDGHEAEGDGGEQARAGSPKRSLR